MNSVMLWPLGVYFVAVIVLVAGMLGISYLLGERHRQKATGEPYESGVIPVGPAHQRFDVKFYMVALFFVIFDLETAFLFAWAVAFRELGWLGYVEVVVFVGILVVALVYLWRVGALDWSVDSRRVRESRSAQQKER